MSQIEARGGRPGAIANGLVIGALPAQPEGVYQMGEVQARSWMVFGTSGSQQAASAPGWLAGSSQETSWALQAQVVQRQVGFSTTRT